MTVPVMSVPTPALEILVVPPRARTPAVIFTSEVETVRPALAVKSPAEVIVPVEVVEMFPEVARVPSSVIVNLEEPPDCTSIAVSVAPFVSFKTKAVAVPC